MQGSGKGIDRTSSAPDDRGTGSRGLDSDARLSAYLDAEAVP